MRYLAWILLLALPSRVQPVQLPDIGAGTLLVAARGLADPNFAESVVLLVRTVGDSTMGLVINNRSSIPISRALPGIKGAEGRQDFVYRGGPVGRNGVLALMRSRARLQPADRVTADVYLVSDKALLEKALTAGTGPAGFRLYFGYSGWSAARLRRELNAGAWRILPADAATIFDPHPDSLWPRLVRKTEESIALRTRGAPPLLTSFRATGAP